MRLDEYIKLSKKSVQDIAKRLGISQNKMYRFMQGHEPSLSDSIKIEDGTNGVVTCRDLLGHIKKLKRGRKSKLEKASENTD